MRTFSGFQAIFLVGIGLLATVSCVRVSAEESSQQVLTSLSSTTISGFVDTSAQWNLGATTPQIPEPSSTALLAMGGIGFYLWCQSMRKRA